MKKYSFPNLLLLAIATGLSWQLAEAAGSAHPYLAPVAVLLAMQSTSFNTLKSAGTRVGGTILGVLLTSYMAQWVGLHGWSVGLSVLVSAGLVSLLRMGDAMVLQAGLSAPLVLDLALTAKSYPLDRIRDTLIGAAVALVLRLLVFPPNTLQETARAVTQYRSELTQFVHRIARFAENGCPSSETSSLQQEAQHLLQVLHDSDKAFEDSWKNMLYNPLLHRHHERLKPWHKQLTALKEAYRHILNILDLLQEETSPTDAALWAVHLDAVAEGRFPPPTLPEPLAREMRKLAMRMQSPGAGAP